MASNVNGVSSSMYCQACGAAHSTQASYCSACGQPLSHATTGNGARTNPLTGLLLPDVILYQRYRIRAVLSTGDVSTVYRAEDIQLGNRLLALKEIGKNNQNTQEALEAIEEGKREMLSLAALVHPNVPRIYDYFVEHHRWLDVDIRDRVHLLLCRGSGWPVCFLPSVFLHLYGSEFGDTLHDAAHGAFMTLPP